MARETREAQTRHVVALGRARAQHSRADALSHLTFPTFPLRLAASWPRAGALARSSWRLRCWAWVACCAPCLAARNPSFGGDRYPGDADFAHLRRLGLRSGGDRSSALRSLLPAGDHRDRKAGIGPEVTGPLLVDEPGDVEGEGVPAVLVGRERRLTRRLFLFFGRWVSMGRVAEEGEGADVVRRAGIGCRLCWEVQVHVQQQRRVGVTVDALQVQVQAWRGPTRLGGAGRGRCLGCLTDQLAS